MKKKILILALVLVLFAVFSASAYQAAIGGEFALRLANGLPSSALLSFRLPKLPPVFGVGVSIPEGGDASFALMADWWLAQGNLVGFVNYYIGPGVYIAVAQEATAGIRVPIGLNAYPIKPLEVFIEFAPAVSLLVPSGVQIPQWGLQAGFGFRFWF
jgi:hypothetical protein